MTDVFLSDDDVVQMRLPGSLDDEARRVCHQLICGRADLSDLPQLTEDPELAAEVQRRLDACGMQLQQARGWGRWVVTGAPELRSDAAGHGLNAPQLAALAFLFVHLAVAPAPGDDETPRMLVSEFTAQFGKPHGWKADFVRRAVLGPLETMEYVKVVTPGGQRRQAFLTAGPRMALLDRARLLRRAERFLDAQEVQEDSA